MPLVYQPLVNTGTLLSQPRLKKLLDQASSGKPESAGSIAELRQSHVQAMRLLLRSGDPSLMSRFLSLRLIDADMSRRLFLEVNPSEAEMRRVVMEYILRISDPGNSAGKTFSSSYPATSSGKAFSSSYPANSAGKGLASSEMNSPPEDSMQDYLRSVCPGYNSASPADRIRRSSLLLGLREPSLRILLGKMPIQEDSLVYPAGTDRKSFFVPPAESSPAEYDPDLFLHMIIHCLFGHMRLPDNCPPDLWDLACDISAESLRKEFFPWSGQAADPKLPEDVPAENAAAVCRWLLQCPSLPDHSLYLRDDHSVWYRRKDNSTAQGPSEHEWQEALQLHGHSASHRRGFAPGSREDKILLREAARNDFRSYLRRFSSVREEIQPDYDSFDYIPYYYGTLLNPDMPLLEPLEYTEANKVDQLAIAIDTSGSCDLPTIQSFLTEVHGILTHRESFFKKMEVHIFQCDSVIQDHTIIRSSEMWEEYIRDITIHGRGGTDFTPVFREIRQIQDAGGLARLKGLIYFSDGDGVYPREQPPYETAFVFSNDQFRRFLVPGWIIPLTLKHQ